MLGQGKQAEAYQILLKMNRINNGKKSTFEKFDIYEEPESIENRERILECKKNRFPLFSSICNQIVPLFKPPYLCTTLLICLIQFIIYMTCNGFLMLFADILNKMANNLDNYITQRAMMCDTINMKQLHHNETSDNIAGEVSSIGCANSSLYANHINAHL